jgi:peptidoglycan/LPS O-acetylase OafA/YrhL
MEYKKPNYQIQMLRGLSVSAVILFHLSQQIFPNGYLGVDIFFIISGYVIAPSIVRMYEDASSNLKKLIYNSLNFIIARLERLTPTLTLVVVATVIVGVFALPIGTSQSNLFSQGLASIGLIANIGAYKTQGDYFAPTQLPLLHIWSLSAEQQIYIFLPLLIVFVSFFRFSSQTQKFFKFLYGTLLLTSVLVYLFFSYAANQGLIPSLPLLSAWIYYSPTTRIIEFLLGAILSRFTLGKLPRTVFWMAFIAIGLILLVPRRFLGYELSLALALALLLSIPLLCSSSKNSESIPNRIMIYLGDRSYSLYLWHLPILIYLMELKEFEIVSDAILSLFCLILIVGFAHLSHVYFEIKVRHELKTLSRRTSVIRLSIFTMILPILLLASLQWLNENNYFREQRTLAKYASALDKNCLRDGIDTPYPCSYNLNQAKSLLLIGDSHAGAISQVVIDVSKKLGYSTYIWTQGGCPILDPNTSIDVFEKFASFPRACQRHNKRILDFIKEVRPDSVIVAQRSERISANGVVLSDFKNSFESYLKLLKNNSNKVLYVGPTPVFPESLYHDYVLRKSNRQVELSRLELNQTSFFENRVFEKITSKVDVSFLDPTPVYCSLSLCEYNDEQGDFFTDGLHLSVHGARKLLPPLEFAILSK